jgi:SAM-dependent methyltransferase
MLARRELPMEYDVWNRNWGAPFGRHQFALEMLKRVGTATRETVLRNARMRRARGPFAFQWNTVTRTYEYPWAYYQVAGLGPSRILEIGGALSGLQFVLAKDGHEVHNVDPFLDYGSGDYVVDPVAEHASLNRAFGTDVKLHRASLSEANLTGSFSAVVSISTIEHLSPDEIEATLKAVKQLLAPGGLLVLTVDLFFNLMPFCHRMTNAWGSNTSVAWIDELLGYSMVAGDRRELYGYGEFSSDVILSRLEEFAVNVDFPQLAQLVTFRAPD